MLAYIMRNPRIAYLHIGILLTAVYEIARLFKELNHIPLRCDEVEKGPETSMWAYIELKMSEAMFRICPDCNKRFFKEDGCDLVRCPCGAEMCYLCGQKLNEDGDHCYPCVSGNDYSVEHQEKMRKAAEEAKKEYLKTHPEIREMILKYDPFKHLAEMAERDGLVAVYSNEKPSDHDYDYAFD